MECPWLARKAYMRANQGHSIKGLCMDELLTPLDPASLPMIIKGKRAVVHGTYQGKTLEKIFSSGGLNRMTRNNIHFTTSDQFKRVMSGFRGSCNALVYVNVQTAMS